MTSNHKSGWYRALFLSDIHLGYKDCKAEYLLNLLDNVQCDILYLVGDIVDLWSLKRKLYWPKEHHQLLYRLLNLPREGTRVVYIPGNHDEAMRDLTHLTMNEIEIHHDYFHETVNGHKLLLIHGDAFDSAVCGAPIMGWIGDRMYDFLLFLNRWFNRARRLIGLRYWSLSSFIKKRVNGAQHFIERFVDVTSRFASKKGFDGVICGHIHQAELIQTPNGLYANCGDWIENCTFLVENQMGDIELQYWADHQEKLSVHRLKPSTALNKKAA
ncbi:UDP-2,3-diacylglucosamine diphosphatase [Pleionea sediminis]|uniref:UDP-2,3-diacylglucosamine diphosphatase n=1 Tax=Pleionea sediminis TaxID=2569479 RepID=UPI001185AD01|nr:UDP-2,3-diacylglucosamine diphosphatase [Pleionea sediminis]